MPKRIQGRFNTGIPEFIAKTRTLMALLESRPLPSCSRLLPFPPFVELGVVNLDTAHQACVTRADSNDIKPIAAQQRARRELKTTLAYVVCYADQILRGEDPLTKWPKFDTRRNPGGGPEVARRVKRPQRRDPA